MCGVNGAGIVWIGGVGKGAGFRYFTQWRKKRKRKPQRTVIAIVIKGKEVEVETSDIRRYPSHL
jgi:hypothetical protein